MKLLKLLLALVSMTMFVFLFLSNTEKETKYFISFHAKHPQNGIDKSILGHIWVGFHSSQGDKYVGFYPGGVKDDTKTVADISICFEVTAAEYTHGFTVVKTYEDKRYIPPKQVCIDMVADIASEAELKLPVRKSNQSPGEWLGILAEKNNSWKLGDCAKK